MEFDWQGFLRIILLLATAGVLGGIVGLERELRGRWAGLRTHMLVSLGAAIFMTAGEKVAADSSLHVSRVLQGIAAGIGFIGAGTILKLTDRLEVKGLTTAATLWVAAAVGSAVGIGMVAIAVAGTFISLIVLVIVRRVEITIDHFAERHPTRQPPDDHHPIE